MLIAAFVLAGAIAMPAMAQDKKADKKAPIRAQKVLVDNDRVRATESTFKPGEANPMQARGYASTKNVGKGEAVIYTVTIKQAK
jgi:hypothetical protein